MILNKQGLIKMRMIQLYGNGISKILRRIHLVGKVSIQKIAERRGNMQQR